MDYSNNDSKEPSIGLAVSSMVLGIVSIVLSCCFPYVSTFTSIIGLILAGVSLKNKCGGKGMAITGLVLSIVVLSLSIILAATIGALWGSMNAYL